MWHLRWALVAAFSGALAASQAQTVLINEFVFNHVGTDTNEFVELFASPSTDLASLRILQIEGDGTGAGLIDSVHTPGTTDGLGFWVSAFLNNVFENGTVSLLLVSGFTGAVGNDIDTNNDGVIDITPWSGILDAVGVNDGGSGDWVYGGVRLDPNFDGGSLAVGGASRIPNGVDTDTVGDWMRNDFDGAGLPGFTGTPVLGEALNTPGSTNTPVPEPATLIGLAFGAAALALRRRKA